MEAPEIAARLPDFLTVASVAVVAYALSNVVHEGLGHGGACLLVGCSPHVLTSMQFDGDYAQLPEAAARIIAAGGCVANLVVAGLAIALLRRSPKASATTWLFFWLLATVCLLQGTGYLLFSGVGNIGDWAAVVRGWPGGAVWRVGLAAVGGPNLLGGDALGNGQAGRQAPHPGTGPSLRGVSVDARRLPHGRCPLRSSGKPRPWRFCHPHNLRCRRFAGRHLRPGVGASTPKGPNPRVGDEPPSSLGARLALGCRRRRDWGPLCACPGLRDTLLIPGCLTTA